MKIISPPFFGCLTHMLTQKVKCVIKHSSLIKIFSPVVSSLQVLPLWHCVPCGREDPGHARPSPPGREAGHVLHHGPVRFIRARPHPAASLLLFLHSQKPLPLYQRAAAGSCHRTGHIIQVRKEQFFNPSQVDVVQILSYLRWP